MSSDDGTAPGFTNPYSSAPRPVVRGVTLGRVGLAAAGVLAVTAAAPGDADVASAPAGAAALAPSDLVALGSSDDVQSDVDEARVGSAYLFPAVPHSGPEVSPVFGA